MERLHTGRVYENGVIPRQAKLRIWGRVDGRVPCLQNTETKKLSEKGRNEQEHRWIWLAVNRKWFHYWPINKHSRPFWWQNGTLLREQSGSFY